MPVSDPATLTVADRRLETKTEKVYSNCDEGIRLPRVTREVKPAYTVEAMRAKIQGRVMLQGIVGTDGIVRELEVLSTLDSGLDEQAIIALRQWRFQPGTLEGKPVPVMATFEMSFNLRDK